MENKPLSPAVLKAHELIALCPHRHLAIDATFGNGHDTLYLSSLFEHVIGFDVQELAYKRASIRLQNCQNVTLILDSFTHINRYVQSPIDLVLFNLGFLPGSDRKVITNVQDVIQALDRLDPLMNLKAFIVIVIYTQHNNNDDFPVLKNYLETRKKIYRVYDRLDHEIILQIEYD